MKMPGNSSGEGSATTSITVRTSCTRAEKRARPGERVHAHVRSGHRHRHLRFPVDDLEHGGVVVRVGLVAREVCHHLPVGRHARRPGDLIIWRQHRRLGHCVGACVSAGDRGRALRSAAPPSSSLSTTAGSSSSRLGRCTQYAMPSRRGATSTTCSTSSSRGAGCSPSAAGAGGAEGATWRSTTMVESGTPRTCFTRVLGLASLSPRGDRVSWKGRGLKKEDRFSPLRPRARACARG